MLEFSAVLLPVIDMSGVVERSPPVIPPLKLLDRTNNDNFDGNVLLLLLLVVVVDVAACCNNEDCHNDAAAAAVTACGDFDDCFVGEGTTLFKYTETGFMTISFIIVVVSFVVTVWGCGVLVVVVLLLLG